MEKGSAAKRGFICALAFILLAACAPTRTQLPADPPDKDTRTTAATDDNTVARHRVDAATIRHTLDPMGDGIPLHQGSSPDPVYPHWHLPAEAASQFRCDTCHGPNNGAFPDPFYEGH